MIATRPKDVMADTLDAQPPMATPAPLPRWATIACHFVFSAACVIYGVSVIAGIRMPADAYYSYGPCDDALYYLVPAERLLAGEGYSFDGEHRTNGVQPLWALVAVVVAAVAPDALAAARLLLLAEGICWGLAALVLYRALNRLLPPAGLVTGVGWLVLGFWNGIGLNGMEAGLSGLMFSAIFAFGANQFTRAESGASSSGPPAPARQYLGLGLLLALATLSRVDYALLAVICGLLVGLALVRPQCAPRLRLNWAGAVLVALPGVVLVGGYCLGMYVYFGTYLPVSGSVKLYYEHHWQRPDLGVALLRHSRLILEGAIWPLFGYPLAALRELGVVRPDSLLRRLCRLAALLGLVAAVLACVQARRAGRLRLTGRQIFLAGLAVFALAHGLMIAFSLPTFASYCVWYLTPQLLALWIAFGCLAVLAARLITRPRAFIGRKAAETRPARAAVLVAAVSALVVLAVARPLGWVRNAPIAVNMFIRAGRWFNEQVPPGQRIGAFNSGRLAHVAPRQQVFNLDGLMNDVQYFRRYLTQSDGPAAYFQDARLEWFADYDTNAAWGGDYWQRHKLELVRWFPAGDFTEPGDKYLSYAIWRRPLDGAPVAPPGRVRLPCRADERLQFAAEVLHQYPVVAEDGAEAALAAGRERHERVVTSIVAPDTGRLHHVLMAVADAQKLDWSPAEVGLTIPVNAVFDGALELVGADLLQSEYRPGQRCVWTLFWRKLPEARDVAGVRFESGFASAPADAIAGSTQAGTNPASSAPGWYSSSGCHATYPPNEWPADELIVETASVPIPPTLRPGSYALQAGVRGPDGGWLRLAGHAEHSKLVWMANIEIR